MLRQGVAELRNPNELVVVLVPPIVNIGWLIKLNFDKAFLFAGP
jgi:hypothetical protein